MYVVFRCHCQLLLGMAGRLAAIVPISLDRRQSDQWTQFGPNRGAVCLAAGVPGFTSVAHC